MDIFSFLTVSLFTIWIFVLLLSEETRQEQLIMSMVGLVLSPAILLLVASELTNDFSFLPLSYLDFIFSFSVFGISSVIYQVLADKHLSKFKIKHRRLKNKTLHWLAHLLFFGGNWMIITLLLKSILKLDYFQSFLVSGLMIGIYIIAHRRDLLANALFSGFLIASLVFLLEKIYWLKFLPIVFIESSRSPTIFNHFFTTLNFGEILWASVVGFAIAPLYEYIRYLKVK